MDEGDAVGRGRVCGEPDDGVPNPVVAGFENPSPPSDPGIDPNV
jgi:hypothetical protein